MQRVSIEDLSALVAQTREAKPPVSDVGLCEEWELGDGDWHPRHNYTGDMNAAMVLVKEMKYVRLDICGCVVAVSIGEVYVDDVDLPVAICLAWLAWKGLEVEVVE